MSSSPLLKYLPAQVLSPERFQLYGQVIYPASDGKLYDASDAQLVLDKGIPRFYIMRLFQRGRRFHTITRHVQCTQCLGSLEGKEWLIAVAPPSATSEPKLEDISAFRIPGNCFIKLEVGTWHAGPYFDDEFVDFYSLELSDTNIHDHQSYNFLVERGLQIEIVGDSR